MMEQFGKLEDNLLDGSITRLCAKLDRIDALKNHKSKYFKLVDLFQTMIMSYVEDERIFILVSLLNSKLRNTSSDNPISSVCLHSLEYDIKNFPYERALTLWKYECNRRGGSNVVDS